MDLVDNRCLCLVVHVVFANAPLYNVAHSAWDLSVTPCLTNSSDSRCYVGSCVRGWRLLLSFFRFVFFALSCFFLFFSLYFLCGVLWVGFSGLFSLFSEPQAGLGTGAIDIITTMWEQQQQQVMPTLFITIQVQHSHTLSIDSLTLLTHDNAPNWEVWADLYFAWYR